MANRPEKWVNVLSAVSALIILASGIRMFSLDAEPKGMFQALGIALIGLSAIPLLLGK